MNKDLGNFYLKPGAAAIDSSVDSLLDRPDMVTIRQPLGIASSPILAPDQDLFGQLRVDDPDVSSPSGLGQDVFKDRGAIDRSDFSGPNALIINPRDNDAAGNDEDERDTFVELKNQTMFDFSIQLIDGIPPSNQSNGSGPDRNTVLPQTVIVTKDGVPIEEGMEYRFSYDATSGIIRLTPLAGIWEPDHAYEIQLLNVDTVVITASSGEAVTDGDTFTVQDENGVVVTFEFDSGYVIEVPATGGATILDGSVFTITKGLTTSKKFEFDSNGVTRPGNVAVPFTAADSPDTVADAIAAAIAGTSLGLTPQSLAGGMVHVGGDTDIVLDTSATVLTQSGLPGVAVDNEPVPFIPHADFTAVQMAAEIASAINASPLTGVTADARQNVVVLIGVQSVVGISNGPVSAIKDLAGNSLQPNRFDGTTAFTIFLGSGLDFGDAPSQYPVLKVDNGARHEIIDGYMLGATVFSTVDGQPSSGADADPGDDGVVFQTMRAAYESGINVIATGITPEMPGMLDAWIDFNADGDWNDPGEQIFDSTALANGTNFLTFVVPGAAAVGTTYARFRLSTGGGLSPTGPAADGEVEDYALAIEGNPWHNYLNSRDVNADTHVSPIDALLIINLLNFNPGISLSPLPVPPVPPFAPPPYYDVNGDGFVSPIDVVLVINQLNNPSGSGEGEGEAPGSGLAVNGGREALVDTGLDSGLLSGQLLVSPTITLTKVAADTGATSTRSDATTLASIETGYPESEASAARLKERFGVTDFRSEDFEDLLEDMIGEAEDLAAIDDAHDAFFARFDV